MNILRWLLCEDCGAEYPMSSRQNCEACAGPLHERTAHDGAVPHKLLAEVAKLKSPQPKESHVD